MANQGKVLNVDQDFGGDIDKAVAAANDGDTVELGKGIYNTSGIQINKDITIDGIRGESIIEGKNAKDSIITINAPGSGSTIQEVELTDGNNGINVKSATNVTMDKLDINNIGIAAPIRDGQNNIAISLDHADGFAITNSSLTDIGRKGIGVVDTDGGKISGNTLSKINLAAEHSQSYDAGGVKLFNTNEIDITGNKMSRINAFNIWNDITSNTNISGNDITGVGEDFKAPSYNQRVRVAGIYNEKSYQSVVDNNKVTSTKDFLAFDATAFTTETMKLGNNNEFSSIELNSTDYWANEAAEKKVAITADPDAAGFDLFADDLYNGGTFGGDPNNVG